MFVKIPRVNFARVVRWNSGSIILWQELETFTFAVPSQANFLSDVRATLAAIFLLAFGTWTPNVFPFDSWNWKRNFFHKKNSSRPISSRTSGRQSLRHTKSGAEHVISFSRRVRFGSLLQSQKGRRCINVIISVRLPYLSVWSNKAIIFFSPALFIKDAGH